VFDYAPNERAFLLCVAWTNKASVTKSWKELMLWF